MHELAHAYHHQVLGFDDERIVAAHVQAKAAGVYEEILSHKGRQVRHYGLTDHKEYFAGEAALKAGGKDNTMNQFAAA